MGRGYATQGKWRMGGGRQQAKLQSQSRLSLSLSLNTDLKNGQSRHHAIAHGLRLWVSRPSHGVPMGLARTAGGDGCRCEATDGR